MKFFVSLSFLLISFFSVNAQTVSNPTMSIEKIESIPASALTIDYTIKSKADINPTKKETILSSASKKRALDLLIIQRINHKEDLFQLNIKRNIC